jgi:hypothetical protein
MDFLTRDLYFMSGSYWKTLVSAPVIIFSLVYKFTSFFLSFFLSVYL